MSAPRPALKAAWLACMASSLIIGGAIAAGHLAADYTLGKARTVTIR